jgi:hypothetical protein
VVHSCPSEQKTSSTEQLCFNTSNLGSVHFALVTQAGYCGIKPRQRCISTMLSQYHQSETAAKFRHIGLERHELDIKQLDELGYDVSRHDRLQRDTKHRKQLGNMAAEGETDLLPLPSVDRFEDSQI